MRRSNESGETSSPLDLEAIRKIDRLCRRFETWWSNGLKPSIAEFLREVPAALQSELRDELIATEIDLRISAGESPALEDYQSRYHVDTATLQDIFAEVSLSQQELQASDENDLSGRTLGDYLILREIGRGGMGIVYEAVQQSLDRRTAVKVLKTSWFHSKREILRFQRESRTVARLHHSNIVEVYGVGQQEGTHYFAMQHIEGIGLDRLIKIGTRFKNDPSVPITQLLNPADLARLGPSGADPSANAIVGNMVRLCDYGLASRPIEVARIGEQVARALQYAHESGVIHRDVKPSNLLLDANGTVWLTDFGLAHLETESVELTRSLDLIGTLRYMAPEVFKDELDERSDVYSLGLTLYELLMLQPVSTESSWGSPARPGTITAPLPPRQIDSQVPRDLETIILKSIAIDPAMRYQAAGELAADLERFQRGEPIQARPVTWWVRLRYWARSNQVTASIACLAFLFLLLGFTTTSLMWRSASLAAVEFEQARDHAIQLQQLAELKEEQTQQLKRLSIERSIQICSDRGADFSDPSLGFTSFAWTVEALRQAQDLTVPTTPSSSGQATKITQAPPPMVNSALLESCLRSRLGAVSTRLPRAVARCWLPDLIPDWATHAPDDGAEAPDWESAILRIVGNEISVTFSTGKQSRLSLETGIIRDVTDQFDHQSDAGTISDADERFLIRRDPSGQLSFRWRQSTTDLNLECSGEVLQRKPFKAWLACQNQRLAVQMLRQKILPEGPVVPMNSLFVWNLADGKLINPAPWVEISGGILENCSDGDFCRVIGLNEILTFDMSSGDQLAALTPLVRRRDRLTMVRDGKGDAIASLTEKGVCVQRVAEPQPYLWKAPTSGHEQITCMSFANLDSELWIGNSSGEIHRHRLDKPDQELPLWQVESTAITAISPDPSGRWVAHGNARGGVSFFEPASGTNRGVRLPDRDPVSSIAWSPGGDLIAVLTVSGLLTVWDLKTIHSGEIDFSEPVTELSTVAFSSSGDRFLVAGNQGKIEIRDTRTGAVQFNLRPDGGEVLNAAWSPDDSHISAAIHLEEHERKQRLNSVLIRNWHTGKPLEPVSTIGPLAAHRSFVVMPSFSADGLSVFAHNVWEGDFVPIIESREQIFGYEADSTGWVQAAAVAPDGKSLAITSKCLTGRPNRVALYQIGEYNTPIWLSLPKSLECHHLTFSPDSRALLACGDFGVRAWDVPSGRPHPCDSPTWQVPARKAVFSRTGQMLLITGFHNSCRLHLKSPTEHDSILGFPEDSFRLFTNQPVVYGAITPDERRVVLATTTGVHLFETAFGKPLMPKLLHGVGLTSAALSPDGTTLIAVGQNGGIRRWTLPLADSTDLEELQRKSQLDAAASINSRNGTLEPLSHDQLKNPEFNLVNGLKSTNPLDDARRIDWHRRQAAESRLAGLAASEIFHLTRLQKLQPRSEYEKRLSKLNHK